ncbi:phage scaffolding protein [Amycolatopsis albispora]|uniref:Scaffolding protein n=1 Tax=Amycolatopsis albispora TaxID=1804986 RepID=A0A344LGY1_9PSEU|nr:phage scaffolding protein [Amycolatopsis albispora]AXB47305.1 hypothetical protein A4R43_36670 [Amycolatopsis albispora]
MAVKMLNDRFRRFSRDTGGDGGTGGGGGGTSPGTANGDGKDGTGSDNKPPEWKPPTQAEWEDHQRKLREANSESAARRKKIEELTRQQETEADKKVREAVEAARAESKPAVIAAVAEAALLRADAKAERLAGLTKLLDHSKIELDGGKVTGLDDEVKRVKAEYPELFKSSQEEKPKPGKIPAGGKAPAEEARTPGEIIAASRNQ